jgi:chloramphenicol 3-O phosphotransferase
MNNAARIVLLNGVGSAGKSSIAKALQTITAAPFLHVQMDTFIEMLPEAYQEHPDGFTYEAAQENEKPLVVIKTGPVGDRTLRGMRHAVVAMAGQGNDVIVDDVLLDEKKREYVRLLSAFSLCVVGVFAPLEVLEARERMRGDRLIGLARWQFDRVHEGMSYDLKLDTSQASPLECAESIKRRFRL